MAEYFHELYDIEVKLSDVERRIIDSSEMQSLKMCSQSGIGAFFSDITYDRFEHTMSVFALTAYFHPGNKLLRSVALNHDLGHTLFSHSIEYATKGMFCHEKSLREKVEGLGRRGIFDRSGFTSDDINNAFEERKNPLNHKGEFVNIDNLAAFLNDSYYGGYISLDLSKIIREAGYDNGRMTPKFSVQGAAAVQDAILQDHFVMFNIPKLYHEALFSRLLELSDSSLLKQIIDKEITEKEVLDRLLDISSYDKHNSEEAAGLINKFNQKNPEKFRKIGVNENANGSLKIIVPKIYPKRVLAGDSILDDIKKEYKNKLELLKDYIGTFIFS